MSNRATETDDSEQREGDTGVRSFTDTSPFVELLQAKTRVEIIDALLRNPEMEMTANTIAELIGRHPCSFHRHKEVLKDIGILEESDKVGQTQLYNLRESNAQLHLQKARISLLKEGNTVSSIKEAEEEEIEKRPRKPQPPEPSETTRKTTEEVAEDIRREIEAGP
jgi:DNA-binding transcriptional ArsR family regulator